MGVKEQTKELLQSLDPKIVLVGVTKYSSREDILKALEAGLEHIAENRTESVDKIRDIDAVKHFIGNIQSNKIRLIVENFDIIQSVSSVRYIEKINQVAENIGKTQKVFLQLKISQDDNKSGVEKNSLHNLVEQAKLLSNIKVEGFMMMASHTSDTSLIREEFREARSLFDKYKAEFNLEYLSMGMSGDYGIAIEEGSNMIRVGSKIFR